MSVSSLSSLSDAEDLVKRRQFPDRVDLISAHDGDEFRNLYRISKSAALQICQRLDLEPYTQRNKPLSAVTQLLITLRFFATGSFLQLDELTNIHKSTVCRIVQRVTQELAKLAAVYIKMPEGEELRTVSDEFYAIDGFPRVAGAVDCTHVKIISRGGALSETFRNREGFFSINVQAVCDVSLRIRDLIVRWPGSVHDCTIFNNSHLRADFDSGRYGDYYLLGDSGYYNRNYLLTPISQPQTHAEDTYNRSHAATHGTVHSCFEVWKRRCPCIHKGISLKKTSTVLQVIVASAVLHNMCIDLNEPEPPNDMIVEQPRDIPYIPSGLTQDSTLRTSLVNTIFT